MQGTMVNSSCLGDQRGGFSFSPWFIALHATGENACRAVCKGKRCWVQGLGGVQGAGMSVPGGAKGPSGCRAGRKGKRRMQSWVQAERGGASRNWGCRSRCKQKEEVQGLQGGHAKELRACGLPEWALYWVQIVHNLGALGCKKGAIWGCKAGRIWGCKGLPAGCSWGGGGAGRC